MFAFFFFFGRNKNAVIEFECKTAQTTTAANACKSKFPWPDTTICRADTSKLYTRHKYLLSQLSNESPLLFGPIGPRDADRKKLRPKKESTFHRQSSISKNLKCLKQGNGRERQSHQVQHAQISTTRKLIAIVRDTCSAFDRCRTRQTCSPAISRLVHNKSYTHEVKTLLLGHLLGPATHFSRFFRPNIFSSSYGHGFKVSQRCHSSCRPFLKKKIPINVRLLLFVICYLLFIYWWCRRFEMSASDKTRLNG